jgi:hypothetical protein
MATNVFSLLPHDVKMHEITRFLNHRDVLAFNDVLRRDERVCKKLPADFALKHALGILKQEHNSIVRRYQIYQDADDFPRADIRRNAAPPARATAPIGEEIAEIVGVPENTVKSRMRYALERLQRALAEYEDYAREIR